MIAALNLPGSQIQWRTLWLGVAIVFPLIGSSAVATPTQADQAVVQRVIDGDTLDVSLDGETVRLRVLNIDAPETKDPDKAVECLGPEASDFLKALLPVGTTVTLRYDVERTDRYGRTLAAVFTEDGLFVGQELARAGLGRAVKYGDNTKYYGDVRDGQKQAQRGHRGLFSPDITCTVPAQVEALRTGLADIANAQAGAGSSKELALLTKRAAAILVALVSLQQLQGSDNPGLAWTVLNKAARFVFIGQITQLAQEARSRNDLLKSETAAAAIREAAAKAKASADAKAKKRAAEKRREARPRVETPHPLPLPAPIPAPRRAPAPKPEPQPDPIGGYVGYTGCRAYIGGTSIDEKGRFYTKIPCP